MADDLGTDIAALDDLPDPEELASGDDNVALAQGRTLLTPDGAHEEFGDTATFASIDLRAYLGKRMSETERQELDENVAQLLTQDDRVATQESSVVMASGGLVVESAAVGDAGPYRLILSIDKVSAQLLKDGG